MTYTQVSTLWSLENIQDKYMFCHEDKQIYNVKTMYKMQIHIDYWGYQYVSLTDKNNIDKNVKYHKIVALALINNGPYELIEHIDDNKLNNDPSNLKFSNKYDNFEAAKRNGMLKRTRSTYEIGFRDGRVCTGNLDELESETKIPYSTLYEYVVGRGSLSPRSKHQVLYFKELVRGSQRAMRLMNKGEA